jgi:hypothetical protein
MSSSKPSKPSNKPGGTTVSRTSASGSSSTRLPTLAKSSSPHRQAAGTNLRSNLDSKSGGGTILRPDLDAKMATRQLKYETLSGQDRIEQEKWAQKELEKSKCVGGFPWMRETGGYRCCTFTPGDGIHFVTDELLAQRRGRQYHASEALLRDGEWPQHYSEPPTQQWANLMTSDGTLWMGPIPVDHSNPREGRRMIRIECGGRLSEFKGDKKDYPGEMTFSGRNIKSLDTLNRDWEP